MPICRHCEQEFEPKDACPARTTVLFRPLLCESKLMSNDHNDKTLVFLNRLQLLLLDAHPDLTTWQEARHKAARELRDYLNEQVGAG